MRSKYPLTAAKGVGLIELLIALVIISVGVLAVARLQIQMIQFNQQALARTQASSLAQDMIDRLRADRNAATAGVYDRALGAPIPAGTTLADRELRHWLTIVNTLLPQGDASIVVNDPLVEIRIRWDDSRGRESPVTFALASRL